MNRTTAAFAVFVALTPLAGAAPAELLAQACPTASELTEGATQPFAAVRYLAHDALEGRVAGSRGERCAGDYIAHEFRRLGLKPAGDDGGYFQNVPLASALNPHAPPGVGRNVLALLEGSDPDLKSEAVIIGAHYDHLGHGGFGSLMPDSREIHNGADDNASGVGALLRAAERLTRGRRPARSILFIAFTGEESGLLGSAHFVANSTVPVERIRGMLNMDMVGRLGSGPLIVYGTETAGEWKEILEKAAAREKQELAMQGEGYGPSDHTSFYSRDIPVLHFFTNTHSDYHRPSDDWDRIDVPGLERVSAIVARVAREVAERPTLLTLQRGAGHPPMARTQGGGYGAFLGSIPDFTPVERGVLLSGVRQGSPAEKAGIRGGDVIVGFGDMEITDLYALTNALRSHSAGQTVPVTVLRDGQELVVQVTLETRE